MTKERKPSSIPAQLPQPVAAHQRDEVVLISADDFRRFNEHALINALQASPSRKTDLAPTRSVMPVRWIYL